MTHTAGAALNPTAGGAVSRPGADSQLLHPATGVAEPFFLDFRPRVFMLKGPSRRWTGTRARVLGQDALTPSRLPFEKRRHP